MMRMLVFGFSLFAVVFASPAFCQNTDYPVTLDGSPYTPGKDSNIDMYIRSWTESMPRNTHGSLIERDILTKGDPMKPSSKGAVLKYLNRFVYATLNARNTTTPTTLQGEQEVFFILSGKGTVKAGKKTSDLYEGIGVLMPTGLPFTITNTGDEPLTMYLLNEPVPQGFRSNKDMLVKDVNTAPVYTGHWCYIAKNLFTNKDGLATVGGTNTTHLDPMTIAQPHSHGEGIEEIWTAITGTSILFLGKQIRMLPPGTAFLIPPDGNTPHSTINITDTPMKFLYIGTGPKK